MVRSFVLSPSLGATLEQAKLIACVALLAALLAVIVVALAVTLQTNSGTAFLQKAANALDVSSLSTDSWLRFLAGGGGVSFSAVQSFLLSLRVMLSEVLDASAQ